MSDPQRLTFRAFAGAQRHRRPRSDARRVSWRNIEDYVQRAEISNFNNRLCRIDGCAERRVEPGYDSGNWRAQGCELCRSPRERRCRPRLSQLGRRLISVFAGDDASVGESTRSFVVPLRGEECCFSTLRRRHERRLLECNQSRSSADLLTLRDVDDCNPSRTRRAE